MKGKKGKQTLEFEAQSVEEMRARWKDALKFAYVHETIMAGGIRPGEVRANNFDFEGGLRVLAMVEKKGEERVLHITACFESDTQEYKNLARLIDMYGTSLASQRWCETVINRMQQVAGEDLNGLKFFGWTQGSSIPHWVKELGKAGKDG